MAQELDPFFARVDLLDDATIVVGIYDSRNSISKPKELYAGKDSSKILDALSKSDLFSAASDGYRENLEGEIISAYVCARENARYSQDPHYFGNDWRFTG